LRLEVGSRCGEDLIREGSEVRVLKLAECRNMREFEMKLFRGISRLEGGEYRYRVD
jgi:hypothetical protein